MPVLLHFVHAARAGSDPRPLCGAWSADVTWTTLAAAVTCSACARRMRRAARAEARRAAAAAAEPSAGHAAPSR